MNVQATPTKTNMPAPNPSDWIDRLSRPEFSGIFDKPAWFITKDIVELVGDSIIGARANIEAGAIIANYRNEHVDKSIRIQWNTKTINTGVDKFGALIGDDARIGANAVVAPRAFIEPKQVVTRLSLVDQSP